MSFIKVVWNENSFQFRITKENNSFTELLYKVFQFPTPVLYDIIDKLFSHMILCKPTGSLVQDRSIPDGDLARGIYVLLCESKQSDATLIVGIVPLPLWPWRHNANIIFPATSKLHLAVIAVALHSLTSSFKHTTLFGYEKHCQIMHLLVTL